MNENDNVTVDGSDYLGNIEYQVDRYFDCDLTYEPVEQKYLYRVHNSEGYVSTFGINSSYGPVYNYYRKDHPGNNREVWSASYKWGSATRPAATNQITQYYPSGLPWKYNTGDNPGSQPYKCNGKEFVEMHGYDTYDFGHRGFYAATDRFTTIDWKAEETYEVYPYSYARNNPVRYRDENGDGFNDLVKGFVNAVTDNTTLGITDQSGTASYDDADDYNTGQAIGNVASVILGGLETIAGGGTAAGGGALAVVGIGTVVAIPVGAAVATGGAAMMAHGTMMMSKGPKNLVVDAKMSQEKKATKTDRQAKREAQTERGKSRTGNSNQGTRGSHSSMSGGNKGDKHSNDEARRAKEQKKADEKYRK